MKIHRQRLLARIGYDFRDPDLLTKSLTHRSHSSRNNERLEFLGDAALNFIIGEALFQKYPELDEGDLSRLRASLVKGETLAEVARELDLGDHLLLGAGEMKSGGHRRDSILADAVEAIIGAIYLESGLSACKTCVLEWYASRVEKVLEMSAQKDPKTQLQETLQARGHSLPEYQVSNITGEKHQQYFKVSCVVELLTEPVFGEGGSRKEAEKQAAQKALLKLKGNQ